MPLPLHLVREGGQGVTSRSSLSQGPSSVSGGLGCHKEAPETRYLASRWTFVAHGVEAGSPGEADPGGALACSSPLPTLASPCFSPLPLREAPPLNAITLGVRASEFGFGGHSSVHSIIPAALDLEGAQLLGLRLGTGGGGSYPHRESLCPRQPKWKRTIFQLYIFPPVSCRAVRPEVAATGHTRVARGFRMEMCRRKSYTAGSKASIFLKKENIPRAIHLNYTLRR